MVRQTTIAFLALTVGAGAQIIRYEGNSFPEEEGWEHRRRECPAERWLQDGWLFQHAEPTPEPCEEADGYRRSIEGFAGSEPFFAEWRLETDGPRSEFPATAPASFVAAGRRGILYHFTIARDQVLFLRDPHLPSVWVDMEPDVAHVYRLELYGEHWYEWFIDAQVGDAGVPEGFYPTSDSFLTFRALSSQAPNTTSWDFIRFGVPEWLPEVECDVIRAFKVRCPKGKIKGKVKSTLPQGTELEITNDGLHRTMRINARGKGRVKYKKQTGKHTILILNCPEISRIVDCGS